MENALKAFVTEWKRSLGRTKGRMEDNINLDLEKILCACVSLIHLPQDGGRWQPLLNTVMNLSSIN
jgi:hypothetical protein